MSHAFRATRLPRLGLVLLAALAACSGHAQTTSSINLNDPALIEKANREGNKVFRWILIHSNQPRKNSGGQAAQNGGSSPSSQPGGGSQGANNSGSSVQTASPAKKAPAARTKDEADRKDDVAVAKPNPPAANAAAHRAGSSSGSVSSASSGLSSGAGSSGSRGASNQIPAAAAPGLGQVARGGLGNGAADSQQLALASPQANSRAASSPALEAAAEVEEDEELIPLRQVDPDFPPSVMRRLQKGSVQVRFEVQQDGTVKEAEVLNSSNRLLNEAAQRAVTQWKFAPLKQPQTGVVELAFNIGAE